MRGCIALLTLLAAFALPGLNVAAAESQPSRQLQLLSYSELMQMPKDKRTLYIAGVREILIDLSNNPDGRFSDSDIAARSKLKAWLQWLDNEIQSAHAQTSELCSDNPACAKKQRECFNQSRRVAVTWDSASQRYGCDTSRPLIEPSHKLKFSDLLGKHKRELRREYEADFKDPRIESGSGPISLGGVAIPTQSVAGTQVTIVNASAITTVAEYAMKNASRYGCRSVEQNYSTPETTRLNPCDPAVEKKIQADFKAQNPTATLAAKLSAPAAIANEAVETKSALPEPTSTARNFAIAPVSPEPNAAVQMTEPVKPIALQVTKADSTPVSETVSSEEVLTDDPPTRAERSRVIAPDELQAYLDRKENPNNICIEEAKKNGASAMDLVRTEDGARYCMTAKGEADYQKSLLRAQKKTGVVTAKRTGKAVRSVASSATAASSTTTAASKYTCAPKPDVCEDPATTRAKVFQGNLSCVFAGMVSKFDSRNRKCTPVTEFKLGDSSYKCDAGQTMCNPFLFGTVSASKPICVGRGKDVTAQCSKLSSPRDAEIFLNRNEAGLQNRWDEFRDSMANVCKSGTIQAKFHCAECNIMKARLFELEARLLGDPCAPGTSADSAVKTRLKSRGTGTTK